MDDKLLYLPNDPGTPSLVVEVTKPTLPTPCPNYRVVGWTGVSGFPGTPQFQAAQVYCTLASALGVVQSTLASPLTKWTATDILNVMPRAGNTFNAYYDRGALRFFYDMDPVRHKVVFACESADVVAHELGHGILDAIRPDLWNTASLEVFSFHESFGDMMAISAALEWPGVVDHVLLETGGDLTKPNAASRVAEELGAAIFHQTGGLAGHADCLRNAVNDYTYVDPSTLPTSGSGLIQEPHSFSQVFTAAWYSALCRVYRQEVDQGTAAVSAITKARNVMLAVLLGGAQTAQESHNFYQSAASAILTAAQGVNNGAYVDAIAQAFTERHINTDAGVSMMDTAAIDPKVQGHKVVVTLDRPLLGHANLVLHLPKSHAMMLSGSDSGADCIQQSMHAVEYARSKNLVGHPNEGKMFTVNQGCFVRNYVCNAFCKDCM